MVHAIRETSGDLVGFAKITRDVSERRRAELELQASEARYRLLADNATDLVIQADLDTTRRYVSPASLELLGYHPEELIGRKALDDIPPEDRAVNEAFFESIAKGDPEKRVVSERRYLRKDGTAVWLETVHRVIVDQASRQPTGYIVSMRDMTERKAAERQAEHAARHDDLTGLPNRRLFRERLAERIEIASREGGDSFALLWLDLDRFKAVNDTFGHQVGDLLLSTLEARMAPLLQAEDMLARLGGDEFAIILAHVRTPHDAAVMAQRVIGAVCQPFVLGGHSINIGMSVGIAVANPLVHPDPDRMSRNADLALYRAKSAGNNCYRLYDSAMDRAVEDRMRLELELYEALERCQFALHYQPIVSLVSGRITGFEALLRWMHPERGTISPASFIPMAEKTGLIVSLGAWVLHQACAEAITWPDGVRVAVNVSAVQFRQPESRKSSPRPLRLRAGAEQARTGNHGKRLDPGQRDGSRQARSPA